MAIKLIVLDLDGTLLKNKWKVDPYSLNVINRIHQEKPDVKIVIATGRAPLSAIKHAKKCSIEQNAAHIICFNGGTIFDIKDEKLDVLYTQNLTSKQVENLYHFANENNLIFYGYDTSNKFAYVNKLTFRAWAIEHYTKLKTKVLTNNIFPEMYKVLLFCSSHENSDKSAQKLVANYPDLEVCSGTSKHPLIEVNPLNVNKAEAVKFLCKKWNITADEVLAVGDGMNDYKMIQWAKYGIAMGNAFDEVKKIAFDITTTNKKGGVGKILEKYLFNEQK